MAKSLSNKFFRCLSVCFLVSLEVNHVKSIECGSTQFLRPLIAYGKLTERGEWPFLTALFNVNGSEFFCGGSLISEKHVLTAAHCINQKGSTLSRLPADIFVMFGAYDLTLRNDTRASKRNVSSIYVHHDWDPYSEKYDADLAILLLNEIVQVTEYIRPVCMPPDNAVPDGVSGSVVGWGLNENGTDNLESIKRVNVTILRASSCYTDDYIVAAISSIRTFCGQGEDGSPNHGDSGGGLFVLVGANWVQYGIVSSVRKNAAYFIDANAVAVYTNVMEFKSWIVNTVTECGSAVGEVKMISDIKIDLHCSYVYTVQPYLYGCSLHDLNLQSTNFAVASFTGFHRFRKTNDDVKIIQFRTGTMFFLPSDIGKIFKNLMHLEIGPDLRLETIRRSNMKNLENLIELNILRNNIHTLDRYFLWDLPNLEDFRLEENHLKEINEGTFKKNLKLKFISLRSNKLEVLPSNLFQHNSLLETVRLHQNLLKVVGQTTFETNIHLREVSLFSNQLEILPRKLFHNNSLLITIKLHGNSLKEIDEEIFAKNEQLGKVSLFSNQLTALPSNLFQHNLLLETLSFSFNSLEVIDGMIFEANAMLRLVDLSRNELEVLHWNLFQNNSLLEVVLLIGVSLKVIDEKIFEKNTNLREVYLSSNQLEALPWNLFLNNTLIEILKLEENFLKVIDERIFSKNTKLRELYLSSNQLQVLPWNLFVNNALIDTLHLQENSLKIIDERIFLTIDKLRILDLNSNQIDIVPTNLLENNLLLQEISLGKNSIKIINEGTFDKNRKLKRLDLSSNQLEIIPTNLLKNNLLLENVDFGLNALKSIDERIFEANVKLLTVSLALNQLEIIPKNLFKNNSLLKDVDFGGNLLKIIEIDFGGFSHLKKILLYSNTCVDAYYDEDDPNTYVDEIKDLTEFLRVIKTNCSLSH